MSPTFKEVVHDIGNKLLNGLLVAAPSLKEVVKFVGDKLLIAVLVAVMTLYGNYLLEGHKLHGNLILEDHKVSNLASINDSNEFMKRVDVVWAKAHTFSTRVRELSLLYWKKDLLSRRMSSPLDNTAAEKEKNVLNGEIVRQRSILLDSKKEFYDVLFQNEFYLGEEVVFRLALYVELTNGLVEAEQRIDDMEQYAEEIDENLSDIKREIYRLTDRLWEIPLKVMLEIFPEVREPEVEARLAETLQLAHDKPQQHIREDRQERLRKLREESISNIRKNAATNRKRIEEKLRELRFDYATARRYSLERKP